MTTLNDKQQQEAREIVSQWWHSDIEGEAELPANSLAQLTDRVASALSSRDAEIREVLEGLRGAWDMAGRPCWCKDLTTIAHEPACLAARALYEKLQPVKE